MIVLINILLNIPFIEWACYSATVCVAYSGFSHKFSIVLRADDFAGQSKRASVPSHSSKHLHISSALRTLRLSAWNVGCLYCVLLCIACK